MEGRTVIVFAGGERSGAPRPLPAGATVIAADSGMDAALTDGVSVDLLIGDLDSISPAALAAAESAGVPIELHSVDKDATDLELAMRAAVATEAPRIIVVGGLGGRPDHFLGNALLLAAPFLGDRDVEWWAGSITIMRCAPGRPVSVEGTTGDTVSLVPIGGTVDGITTDGLRWALADAAIQVGSTRGISNEMTGHRAAVRVGDGVLLVAHERRGSR